MRTIVSALLGLGLAVGCNGASTGRHIDAITGEACEIDPDTYVPRDPAQPDPRVDCAHHHDDVPHGGACCEFPQPGCDANGCCDGDIVVFPDDGGGDEVDEGDDQGPIVI